MKKRFKLEDLCCANCAAKMEAGIKKIDGVHDATVNFLTQKLSVDADDARLDGKVVAENISASGAHQLGKIVSHFGFIKALNIEAYGKGLVRLCNAYYIRGVNTARKI